RHFFSSFSRFFCCFIFFYFFFFSAPAISHFYTLSLHDALPIFFNPAGLVVNDQALPHSGGSPLLWQHLFCFFGHPEVYIAILPGFGIISTILPVFARKRLLGSRAVIGCMVAIGFLSYMVWGHH